MLTYEQLRTVVASTTTILCKGAYCSSSLHSSLTNHSLRIGAIFIVMATSAFGTLLPIITGRIKGLGLPKIFYDTVKVSCSLILMKSFVTPTTSTSVLALS